MNTRIEIAILIVICGCIGAIVRFFQKTKETKIANIKEWLKYAVTEAEKSLGAGTGQLKLRQVYDLAIQEFPWLVQLISFNVFSTWVDEALDWMRVQLSDNQAVKNYVEG